MIERSHGKQREGTETLGYIALKTNITDGANLATSYHVALSATAIMLIVERNKCFYSPVLSCICWLALACSLVNLHWAQRVR